MNCPQCGYDATKVLDSRASDAGLSIRRRRECESCEHRFTTYEKVQISLLVSKSGNRKERYKAEKLEDSLLKATNKRNISITEIEKIIQKFEQSISVAEISSEAIGAFVMQELKNLDAVSAIRYASVHQSFSELQDFINFIKHTF